jgi:hypothetical protein
MAAFAIVDYVTPKQNTPDKVAALMETYLETKDSTTNTIYGIGIESVGGEFYGWILHAGT